MARFFLAAIFDPTCAPHPIHSFVLVAPSCSDKHKLVSTPDSRDTRNPRSMPRVATRLCRRGHARSHRLVRCPGLHSMSGSSGRRRPSRSETEFHVFSMDCIDVVETIAARTRPRSRVWSRMHAERPQRACLVPTWERNPTAARDVCAARNVAETPGRGRESAALRRRRAARARAATRARPGNGAERAALPPQRVSKE